MEAKRQEVLESIASVEARFKADIRNLEESANRNKPDVPTTPTASKHDRSAAAEDEEDDHDDHQQEGPALPSTGFKITIQNHDVAAQVKTEGSPKIVRMVDEANPGKADGAMESESASSYLDQGENFQITFKTDRDSE